MAKFLTIALVVLSVVLEKTTQAEDDEKFDQAEVESGLNEIFNLTADALKKECDVDIGIAWPTIGAALDKLQKFADDFEKEAAEHFTDDDPRYEERVQANCQNSEPFKNARMNIIEAALPCALEDRLSELMKISESNTC